MSGIMEQEQTTPVTEIERKIRDIDQRLQNLRGRRQKAEAELKSVTREERRAIRNFAEATGPEKNELGRQLEVLAEQRTKPEREIDGLTLAIEEAEQERTTLLPEFEAQCKVRTEAARKRKLEELRRQHDKNLEAVRGADKALLVAREAAEKSFFDLTTFKDNEAEQERQRAWEAHKIEAQKNSGPLAPGNRR